MKKWLQAGMLAIWTTGLLGAADLPDPDRGPLAAAVPGGYFFDAARFDLAGLLPPPPAPESVAGQAEIETVLQVQAARTPEQVAWAQFIEQDSVFKNARVIGAWFTEENLPLTAAFFAKVDADLSALRYKALFPRKRPPFVDARVQPCVTVADTGAYPSGHSSRAWLWAGLLAEIFPEMKTALAERARAVSWGRVIGGAHFPSDTAGGKLVGKAVVEAMLKNPAVRAELEKCRAEVAPFLMKKAA